MWPDTESDSDYLNFGEVSQLAVDILKSPDMLPCSIGVFGNWGAGKSSLLKLIEKDLQDSTEDWIVIRFDAWLYQGFDDARAALLEVIATELNKEAKDNEGLTKKTKKLLARVNGFRALGLAAEGAALLAGIPTGGMLARGVGALSGLSDGIQDHKEFEDLGKAGKEAVDQVSGLLGPDKQATPPQQIAAFRKEYGEILEELGRPLVVVIDNLDRCLPSNAIHTLEAIRLFLFLPNTAFIIAADEEMIRSSVANYFKGASDRHQIDYLDKLIQVPIRVPKAGIREIRSYLFMLYAVSQGVSSDKLEALRAGLEESLRQSWRDEPISRQDALALTGEDDGSNLATAYDRADRIAPVLANSPIIHGNPRIVKRLLNVVKMRSQIARRRSMPLDEAVITKLVIFERCVGTEATADFYRFVDAEQGKPTILKELEEGNGSDLPVGVPKSWSTNPTTKSFILEWSQLEPSLRDVDLRAAIYLSRETMPVGAYVVGLSPQGREALNVLAGVTNMSSPAAKTALGALPMVDQVPVMEGIINRLRQNTDWSKKPTGFSGGCLLAQHSTDAAKVFKRYIGEIGKLPPWLSTQLREEQWYKDA